MHAWFSENLDILLERDPALAAQVMRRVGLHSDREASGLPGPLPLRAHDTSTPVSLLDPFEALPTLAHESSEQLQRVVREVQALPQERPVVVLGLGLLSSVIRAAIPQHLVVIEPSLAHFVAFLSRQALLPLTLNGRLYIASDLDEVERALCTYGSFSLYRLPSRPPEAQAYFSELERRLHTRASQISRRFDGSRAGVLSQRAPVGSPLASFLASLPPDEMLTLERIRTLIEARGGAWGQVERVFMALECFK